MYFLLYFINSEVANERYYREFLSSKTYTQQYLENIVRLKGTKIEADDLTPVYETPSFQQAFTEISTFLGEMNGHPAKEMQELVEFYMVLHDLDIDEAMNAASKIGDDAIQKRMQGHVVPDSFTHGTSAQRVKWFNEGFMRGDVQSCNTFG